MLNGPIFVDKELSQVLQMNILHHKRKLQSYLGHIHIDGSLHKDFMRMTGTQAVFPLTTAWQRRA